MKKLIASIALLCASSVFAATLAPVQLLNPAGSTSGQAIVSTGPSTAPAWGGVSVNGIAAIAANRVLANVTGSSASPTAAALPSCSTANSALQYTSGTGFSCGTTFALTSGTLAQFAATTSAQLAGIISDETGSGALVFGTSPTIASPTVTGTLGAAAITASSTITPSQTAGIVGTTTNNDANAGSVGEYICAEVTNGGTPSPVQCGTVSTTPVSMTSGTSANITSLSLTAGDWRLCGSLLVLPAGSTNVSNTQAYISTTSATIPASNTWPANGSLTNFTYSPQTGAGQVIPMTCTRLKFASTTTVYLVANFNFTTSTLTAGGFLSAERRR